MSDKVLWSIEKSLIVSVTYMMLYCYRAYTTFVTQQAKDLIYIVIFVISVKADDSLLSSAYSLQHSTG